MRKVRTGFLSGLLLLVAGAMVAPASLFGQDFHHQHGPEASGMVKFVENQRQWEDHILYAADLPGGRVFFEEQGLTYLFADLSHLHDAYFHGEGERDSRPIDISCHAYKVKFEGAEAQPRVSGSDKYEEYHNYFIGNDPSRWAGGVPLFAELAYADLWPGITGVFQGKEMGLKYSFIVEPGSDPEQIRMVYEGLDRLYVNGKGQLVMETSLGDIIEDAPVAFQNGNPLSCHFVVEGNTVTFELPVGYDPQQELVIDPSLIFGSFTGSFANNFGYTATYDDGGNLYGGGIAFGLQYPVTPGAFQTTFQGGPAGPPFGTAFDISISKFNPTGTALVWSTFLGGNGNEQPHSLITNSNSELVVYGRSFSPDFPMQNPYQGVLAGGSDIIVTRFNAAGTALIGSTYLGGSGNDGLNIHTSFFTNSLYFNYGDDARGEVMLDDQDNVYIASCTQSQNFPVTPGVVQGAFGGGLQDGCVFKLSPNLSTLTWSTYLGGNANDAAYSIKVDPSGNAYVAGGTESPNFPTTAGVQQPAQQGGIDGFVSVLDNVGSTLLASSYVGTAQYDQCYFLELDASQNIYLVGQSLGSFPVTAGTYSNPGSKQFIVSYSSNLASTNFSTVFGSGRPSIDLSPTAFLVDRCGFIYVSGWGGGTNFQRFMNNMPITPGAFQPVTDDSSDVYLIVLEPEAAGLEYATYFGGPDSQEHVDGGTSRFDKDLIVYQAVCAGCQDNDDFPTTPGVVSQDNNSMGCNLGVFKFAFEPQDVLAAYLAQAVDSCAPFPVNFTNNSQGAVNYIWNFGDGSPEVNTFDASHIYQFPGTYTVTLIAIDSNSCNFADTATQTVTVYANPIALADGSDTVCAGASVQLGANGGQFYEWSPGIFLTDSTIANPMANPPVSTTFQVIVSDSNGCVDTASVDVYVTNFDAEAGPPVSFCEGTGGAQLTAGQITGGTAPYWYEWWCDSTITFCGLDSVFDDDPIANPNGTTTYYLQVTDSRGCVSNIDSTVVEMLPVPIADAGPDQWICQPPSPGALLQGSFSNAPAPFTYYWINGTGLNDSTLLNPYARPDTTTIYTLVGISANGCSSNPTTTDTLSTVTVHVNPQPIAEAGPTRHICYGDSIQLQGYGTGAGPDYDFEWSPVTGLSDSTVGNPFAGPPLTTEYTLTVWSNGCPSIGDTVTVWVHTLPTPSAGNIREICLGDSAQLDAFGAGDSSATYTYQWWPSAGMNDPHLENPSVSPDTTTWYYLIATSSWGCESATDSVLVKLKPTPIAEAGPNMQRCADDSTLLQGSYYYTTTDSADPSQIYYAWSPNQFISDTTITSPTVMPPGSYWYYLDVLHNTCSTRDSVLVTVQPEIGAWAMADSSVICEGDSVMFSAGGGVGGASFTWIPTLGLADPGSAQTWASPGDSTHYLVVVEEGGCTDTVEVDLAVIPRPDMAFLNSLPSGCAPLEVSFQSNSEDALNWIWHFGDGSQVDNTAQPTHTYAAPGRYPVFLSGTNLGACRDESDTLWVEVFQTPVANFATDPAFPIELNWPETEVQFTDLSQNAASWWWDFGDGGKSEEQNPVYSYQKEGVFMVTLTVESGENCRDQITRGPFTVLPTEIQLYNVFSPNGDGVNDLYLVHYTGDQPFQLMIYDRWGQELFATQNKLEGWDGTTGEGQAVPDGVYFYVVKAGDREFTGSVTLLR